MDPGGVGGDYDQNTLSICITYKSINKNIPFLRSEKLS